MQTSLSSWLSLQLFISGLNVFEIFLRLISWANPNEMLLFFIPSCIYTYTHYSILICTDCAASKRFRFVVVLLSTI